MYLLQRLDDLVLRGRRLLHRALRALHGRTRLRWDWIAGVGPGWVGLVGEMGVRFGTGGRGNGVGRVGGVGGVGER